MCAMTVVFVHGNPETDAVWDPLVEQLDRDDVVRLSPPGFGAPLPDGWPATYLDYRDWLEGKLTGFANPGDVVGLFDPEYVWHDLAQVWQTPGEGEKLVDTMMGAPVEEQAQRLIDLGMTPEGATKLAAGAGAEMGRPILLLSRSARQPVMARAGQDLEKAAARPGLSVLATEDHYVGSAEIRRRAAERAGARTEA